MGDVPLRIQRRRSKGWRSPPNTVSVTRPGPWGNPYRIGARDPRTGGYFDRDSAVERYLDSLILGRLAVSEAQVARLRGKNLACWCKLCDRHKDGKPFDVECPDCEPCHADVLGCLANGLTCESIPSLKAAEVTR